MPNILRQPSFPRNRGKIPMHKEDHLCSDRCFSKIASILSGKSNSSHDGPINQEGIEQIRSSRINGIVDY